MIVELKNMSGYKESVVTAKSSGFACTVDIEVDDDHSYVVNNGIISHNTSVLLDNVTNGIEPAFMTEYIRTAICKDWSCGLTVDYIENNFKQIEIGEKETFTAYEGQYNGETYYYEPNVGGRGLCKKSIVRDYGYEWVSKYFPNDIGADYIVTTNTLGVQSHIDIQSVAQRYCNQSISKTVNIPNNYPFEDFKSLYMEAWRKKLIGITTYRDGTMSSVLSRIDDNINTEDDREIIIEDLKCPDEFINGPTTVIKRERTKYYINFSYLPEDHDFKFPFAMWISTNNLKSELPYVNKAVKSLCELITFKGVSETLIDKTIEKLSHQPGHNKLSRMVSLALRHNISIPDIVGALKGIEGDHISSLLTAVRKFLSSKIKDGVKCVNDTCVSCGSTNMEFSAGCSVCKDCGFSGCN